jgi:hypothetical protein
MDPLERAILWSRGSWPDSACNGVTFDDYPYCYHLPEGKRVKASAGVLSVQHGRGVLILTLILAYPNHELLLNESKFIVFNFCCP